MGIYIWGSFRSRLWVIGILFSQELMESRNKYLLPPAVLIHADLVMSRFTGLLDLLGFGKIANFAHLGGLIAGFTMSSIFKLYNDSKL